VDQVAELKQLLIAAEARAVAAEARAVAAETRIAELEKQVAQLLARLNSNSGNSGKPPSTDSPSERAERKARQAARGKQTTRKTRGAQPGHKGSQRALAAPEQVSEFVDHFPDHCEGCAKALPSTPQAAPLRAQTWELPPMTPVVVEHRFHAVSCVCCGTSTRAPWAPPPTFGPRLHGVVATLTGAYHVSRRKTASLVSDLVGLKISVGAISEIEARVSESLKAGVAEVWRRVDGEGIKHADGTSWFQQGVLLALWTIATASATVFKVLAHGNKQTLSLLLGSTGTLVSDRATALKFWSMDRRQVCWAHLLRKFVAFSERGGKSARLGDELLDYIKLTFDYWHEVKGGRLNREEFRRRMVPIRTAVEELLQRGADARIAGLSGSCADILEHKKALWTFVDRDDVEPTNNHAERELRAFVMWRKRSQGTQSERGNLYAERIMTTVHTARKQNKNVLDFLTATYAAHIARAPTPSLFAPTP